MKTRNFLLTMMVMFFFTVSSQAQDRIRDADNDTRVETERFADEDQIRFRLGGTDKFRMRNSTLEMLNTGNGIFIGENAGINDDLSLNNNVFIGTESGRDNTTGSNNVSVGRRSFRLNITGFNNLALGTLSMENSLSNNNLGIGANALRRQTTGGNNVGIGSGAGLENVTGGQNVFIGQGAGRGSFGASKSGSVMIGYRAGENEDLSNKLYIENSGSANPLIYGDFATDDITFNADASVIGKLDIDASLASSEIAAFRGTGSKWIALYDGTDRKGILWNVGNDMVLRADDAGGSVEFQTNGFNNRMEIGSDGDIGVGVTAAGSRGKFHIQNGSGIDDPELNLESTGTGFSRLEFGNSAGDGYWHIAADANGNPKMNFWYDEDGSAGAIAGQNVFTIDGDDQRIGINSANPGNTLEVNGATGGSGQFVNIEITDDTGLSSGNDVLQIKVPATAVDGVSLIEAERGTSIVFQVNADGNTDVNGLLEANTIAVGTTSVPGDYLFAIDGKAIMEELKIEDSGSWPDYVFESDYQLRTLEEVEASINANGHLPGIPSAEEVEEEGGIMIGNMQRLTIEKVEELTLYAIDADKKIKALNKENTELKNTLEELIKRIEQLEKK